ncbi:unnamed protein product [Penicillium pancosmium]
MRSKKRADNWVDGLRGIAALMVVTYHVCSSFASWLNSPAMNEKGTALLFQYPFFRLVVSGRSALALFFIITGYVNSFRAIKETREGDMEGVLTNISRNTIGRIGKLIVPTNAAILSSWLVCQLNGHRIARVVESAWIQRVSCAPGPSFGASVEKLLRNLTLFWHDGQSPYDGTYWTIPFFLQGSMIVYLTLLATTFARPRYTKGIIIFLYLYSWAGGQSLVETNIYAGMFLAELNADFGPHATSVMPRAISALVVVFGLFLSSIPEENTDWMPWSRAIVWTASMIVPAGGEINRYVVSAGTTVVMYGAFFSPDARRILSHPVMNFLGRISFPVYLLHNTLIRTVLSWMVYRHDFMMQGLHPVDDNGNPRWLAQSGFVSFWTSILVFYACLLYSAHLWTIHVDPRCEAMVIWMSNRVFGNHKEHTPTKDGVLVGTPLAKWQIEDKR